MTLARHLEDKINDHRIPFAREPHILTSPPTPLALPPPFAPDVVLSICKEFTSLKTRIVFPICQKYITGHYRKGQILLLANKDDEFDALD